MKLDGKEMVIDSRTMVVIEPLCVSPSWWSLVVDGETGHVDAIHCCEEMGDAMRALVEKRKP